MLILQLCLYCTLFFTMVALDVWGGAVNALYFYPGPVQERAYAIGLADKEATANSGCCLTRKISRLSKSGGRYGKSGGY